MATAKRILAVDPGYTTGIAMWSWGETSGTELGEEAASPYLYDFIADGNVNTVLCESFRITAMTAKNTQAPWSLELIGVLRLACRKSNTGFILQSPSDAKGFSTDTKLKALGWYTPGAGHQNDAYRHLLLGLVKVGWWDDRLLQENT